MEKVDNKIGLWENKDKNGNVYYSVTKDGMKYMLFPNQYYVEGGNKPRFNMLINKVEPKAAAPVNDDLPF